MSITWPWYRLSGHLAAVHGGGGEVMRAGHAHSLSGVTGPSSLRGRPTPPATGSRLPGRWGDAQPVRTFVNRTILFVHRTIGYVAGVAAKTEVAGLTGLDAEIE